jgi:hypothetical protein
LVLPTARVFCSTRCRQRAARRRAAGLPENALGRGSHGSRSLAESYEQQIAAELRAVIREVAA